VRIGGDEFGTVLRGADAQDPGRIAARISTRLEEPFTFGAVAAEIRASIGIALAKDTADAAALLEHADAAMYEAKREGLPFAFYGASSTAARPGCAWRTSSAPRSTPASCCCTTSPSSISATTGSRRSRRSCAGSTPSTG
jgi:GGDEF domain-containing protein